MVVLRGADELEPRKLYLSSDGLLCEVDVQKGSRIRRGGLSGSLSRCPQLAPGASNLHKVCQNTLSPDAAKARSFGESALLENEVSMTGCWFTMAARRS